MKDCRALNLPFCYGCLKILDDKCWIVSIAGSFFDVKDITLISDYINLCKGIHNKMEARCFYEALKQKRPHLIDKIDKLMVLI